MNVLLIGATGYIGSALAIKLRQENINLVTASRSQRPAQPGHLQVDTLEVGSLMNAMRGMDVVVNCVSGDAASISQGAKFLVDAALQSNVKKIVHMSSMAVYGFGNAEISEDTALTGGGNWYADAKIQAESEMAVFASKGEVVIFRIGCVAGGGSVQWVQRIGDLLAARRIGDLGRQGDGWSNIVALEDVCQAVVQAVVLSAYPEVHPNGVNIFNLAGPGSPRWNQYFVDLAQLIGAIPPKRISPRRLQIEGRMLAPASLIYRKVHRFLPILPAWNSPPLAPSLLRLFQHAGRLDTSRVESTFSIPWTSYQDTVSQGAAWYIEQGARSSSA